MDNNIFSQHLKDASAYAYYYDRFNTAQEREAHLKSIIKQFKEVNKLNDDDLRKIEANIKCSFYDMFEFWKTSGKIINHKTSILINQIGIDKTITLYHMNLLKDFPKY